MVAVENGRYECVEVLLANGANVNAATTVSMACLFVAVLHFQPGHPVSTGFIFNVEWND